MAEDFEQRLASWFSARIGAHCAVRDVVHHAEGFSWQTFTLTVDTGTTSQGYALRCEPPDGVLAPYDLAGQYALHGELLANHVAPLPARYWVEPDAAAIGMPFYAMERMPGRVPGPLERQPFAAYEEEPIRHDFISILASIHAADWRAFSSLGAAELDPHANARQQIAKWQHYYELSKLHDVPAATAAFEWLERNIEVSGRVTLCHGDYRLGNFMMHEGRINAIFDWELAHVGDPIEDLGWCALLAFRGRAKDRVAHLFSLGEFLDRYTAASGYAVDPDCFLFWTVLAHVKAIAIYLRGARAFEDGRSRDLRLALVGNRSIQLVADLLGDLPI